MIRQRKYLKPVSESVKIPSLKVDDIHLSFGGILALQGISLELNKGEILAIIGPNGAGKTCILNCVSGFYRPQRGNIHFGQHELTSLPPHKIAELGIARTFQNIELYTGMTTVDNLLAARHCRMRSNFIAGGIYFGWAHKEEVENRKIVEEIVDFLELESVRKQPVGLLAYGLRKRIELGRALAMEPKILLLDEPMAGMNLEEKEDMARFIIDVHDLRGTPILIIEHDMGVVMDIASRIIVLDFGRLVAEGPPQEIATNPQVIKAYLGEEYHLTQGGV